MEAPSHEESGEAWNLFGTLTAGLLLGYVEVQNMI